MMRIDECASNIGLVLVKGIFVAFGCTALLEAGFKTVIDAGYD